MKHAALLGLFLGLPLCATAEAKTLHDVLVGGWVPKGGYCASGDVFFLRSNGKFEMDDSTGSWTLNGDVLSIHSWDNEDPKEVSDSRERILRVGPTQVEAMTSQGKTDIWVRCK